MAINTEPESGIARLEFSGIYKNDLMNICVQYVRHTISCEREENALPQNCSKCIFLISKPLGEFANQLKC